MSTPDKEEASLAGYALQDDDASAAIKHEAAEVLNEVKKEEEEQDSE